MVPALAPDPDGAAEAFARRLAGDNGPAAGGLLCGGGRPVSARRLFGGDLRPRLHRPGPPAGRICRGRSDGARRRLHGAADRGALRGLRSPPITLAATLPPAHGRRPWDGLEGTAAMVMLLPAEGEFRLDHEAATARLGAAVARR